MESPITNDVFDSRDLIEYKEFLEQEILDAYIAWAEDANDFKEEDAEDLEIPDDFDSIEFIDEEAFTIGIQDTIDEYEAIKDFVEQLEGYGDFEHGESIISEDYFEQYCEEFIKDCGYIPNDLPAFIENNINWDGVADDMKQDYTEASYNRQTYLMRS